MSAEPWQDEGWFASPAYNLLHHGHMGTTTLDPHGYILRQEFKGLARHTYWVLPAHLLAQAGWYAALGFGLLQMRLLSTLWSLLIVVSLFAIVKTITDRRVDDLRL